MEVLRYTTFSANSIFLNGGDSLTYPYNRRNTLLVMAKRYFCAPNQRVCSTGRTFNSLNAFLGFTCSCTGFENEEPQRQTVYTSTVACVNAIDNAVTPSRIHNDICFRSTQKFVQQCRAGCAQLWSPVRQNCFPELCVTYVKTRPLWCRL